MLSLLTILILSYLAGSIPTAVWTSRVLMKDDIRNHGSRNAGATNVFRVMGWKPALFVLLVDMAKGLLAVLLITRISIDPIQKILNDLSLIPILAGLCAIAGHIWTVFAGFRGGKGVGTAFGVMVAIMPVPSLIALGIWLILVFATRIVSVGSVIAALSLTMTVFCQRFILRIQVPDSYLWIAVILSLLILFTHRANIGRLMHGEEHRFGFKNNPPSTI
jgi:glycerol-3-phosphate acyltransferase PlsY